MSRDRRRFASESPICSSKRLKNTNREVPQSPVASTPEGIVEQAKKRLKALSPLGKSVNALANLVSHARDTQIKQQEEIARLEQKTTQLEAQTAEIKQLKAQTETQIAKIKLEKLS